MAGAESDRGAARPNGSNLDPGTTRGRRATRGPGEAAGSRGNSGRPGRGRVPAASGQSGSRGGSGRGRRSADTRGGGAPCESLGDRGRPGPLDRVALALSGGLEASDAAVLPPARCPRPGARARGGAEVPLRSTPGGAERRSLGPSPHLAAPLPPCSRSPLLPSPRPSVIGPGGGPCSSERGRPATPRQSRPSILSLLGAVRPREPD